MTRAGQTKMFPELPVGSRILQGPEISSLAQSVSLVQPFIQTNLAPCSYDLSAGAQYVEAGGGATENTSREPLTLGPGSYAGLISKERVRIPPNVYVVLGPKRKLSYEGIILLSGSVVDPGYEGHLLFVLFNSSGKKRIIYPGKKICVATFFQLDKAVENPIGPDPSLAAGNFPGEFLDSMANMELPSMVEINEKIGQITSLQTRLHELEKTYSDVTKPVKDLVDSVGKLTRDIEALTETSKRMFGKIEEHDKAITEHGFKIKYVLWIGSVLVAVLVTLALNNLAHPSSAPVVSPGPAPATNPTNAPTR